MLEQMGKSGTVRILIARTYTVQHVECHLGQ